MSFWFKRSLDLARNPKIRKLGKGLERLMGAFLFEELIVLSHKRDRGGVLRPEDVDPELLAEDLSSYGYTEESIAALIAKMVDVGLLDDDLGFYAITGYDDYRPPLSSTERSRRHRSKVPRDAMQRDATPGPLHGDGCNAPEQSKADKKRGDQKAEANAMPGSSSEGACHALPAREFGPGDPRVMSIQQELTEAGLNGSIEDRHALSMTIARWGFEIMDVRTIKIHVAKRARIGQIKNPGGFLRKTVFASEASARDYLAKAREDA